KDYKCKTFNNLSRTLTGACRPERPAGALRTVRTALLKGKIVLYKEGGLHHDCFIQEAHCEPEPSQESRHARSEASVRRFHRRFSVVGDPSAGIVSDLHLRIHRHCSIAAWSAIWNQQFCDLFLLRIPAVVPL